MHLMITCQQVCLKISRNNKNIGRIKFHTNPTQLIGLHEFLYEFLFAIGMRV